MRCGGVLCTRRPLVLCQSLGTPNTRTKHTLELLSTIVCGGPLIAVLAVPDREEQEKTCKLELSKSGLVAVGTRQANVYQSFGGLPTLASCLGPLRRAPLAGDLVRSLGNAWRYTSSQVK